jgi:hypothetical protein
MPGTAAGAADLAGPGELAVAAAGAAGGAEAGGGEVAAGGKQGVGGAAGQPQQPGPGLDLLAAHFAGSIPEERVSMAQLQGFLMAHKYDPAAAARDATEFARSLTLQQQRCWAPARQAGRQAGWGRAGR